MSDLEVSDFSGGELPGTTRRVYVTGHGPSFYVFPKNLYIGTNFLGGFIDVEARHIAHDPQASYTAQIDGTSYPGCRTQYVDLTTTRLILPGAPAKPQDETPRRAQVHRYTPAEMAIHLALIAIEWAGADPLLTDAVILLHRAKDRVADYVDGVPRQEKKPPAPTAWMVEDASTATPFMDEKVARALAKALGVEAVPLYTGP